MAEMGTREEPGLPERGEAAFSPGRVDSEVPVAPETPRVISRVGGRVQGERDQLALQGRLKEPLVWCGQRPWDRWVWC